MTWQGWSASAIWLIPFGLVLLVVVVTTVVVTTQLAPPRPRSVVIQITNGPTVISTQVVPIR